MSAPQECVEAAFSPEAALELNRTCRCWPVERRAIVGELPEAVEQSLNDDHHHLFADTGVFLHPTDLQAMQAQIGTAEHLLRAGSSREQADSTSGLLMGYDFHLTADGPQLIEINTNAGGAFLVQHMTRVLDVAQPTGDGNGAAEALVAMFAEEWRRSGRSGVPQRIAIIDSAPEEQYLYPDMLLAARLLSESPWDNVTGAEKPEVKIADVSRLQFVAGGLQLDGERVDLVYNRLTDFAFAEPESAELRAAWRADAVVVSPSPTHHAMLADKRNLVSLSDADQRIPQTTLVGKNNADELWRARKRLFFKPADGFGSRATYRGAGVTRRVWNDIVAGNYVAQKLIAAPRRARPQPAGDSPESSRARDSGLKFDLRVYTYAAQPLLLAARIYAGQTTNFRTAGGGFAPVQLLAGSSPAGA